MDKTPGEFSGRLLKPVWKEFADEIGQDVIDAAQAANKG